MVDLVKLTRLTWTSFYIMTEYRQSTDKSAPTNSPLAVALSRSSCLQVSFRESCPQICINNFIWMRAWMKQQVQKRNAWDESQRHEMSQRRMG
ncbi:hypothetical protein Hanom_Chr05g00402201 [Helianthus anomalus]